MSIALNNISPGVYTKIIDLSYYLQEVPGTAGFIPFFSRRGPDNVLTRVSGQPEYKSLYGNPNINDYGKAFGQGPYIAWNHLSMSGDLYSLRLLPDDALFANLFIVYNSDGTGSIEISHRDDITQLKTEEQKQANTDKESDPIKAGKYAFALFYPIGRGDSYNDFGIVIKPHSNIYLADQGVYTLNVYETSDTMPIDNIVESFEISFDTQAIDESGDSIFISEVVNRFSKNLRCYVDEDNLNEWRKSGVPLGTENLGGALQLPDSDPSTDEVIDSQQEYPVGSGIIIDSPALHLTGGSEGSLVNIDIDSGRRITDSTTATSLLIQGYMGSIDETVVDLDNIYFPVVYDAGYPSEVKEQGIRFLVEDMRRDCFAFCDNGDNASVSQSTDARIINDFNTFYMGLFEPFNKVYDPFTGKKIWFSPIYHLSSLVPKNDALYAIWYPSAGLNRAALSNIEEMRFNPKLNERDILYLDQINPICQFTTGYTVWGNLTTQKRPSKLSNISTVRTVLYIKRALEQFCKWYIFEFNDADTHTTIAGEVAGFLQTLQDAKALEGFSVEVGAIDYEKKQKICHVNVILVPVGIIERINLNLYVQ